MRPILLALVLLAFAAPTAFGQAVVLKPRLVAQGDVVTLGDLFEGAGEAASAPLSRAPAPGETISLDPAFVQRAAREAGLTWANASGLVRLTVERAAREVPAAEIAAMIEELLFMETGLVHQVEIGGVRQTLAAPLDSLGGPDLRGFEHDSRSGLFRAEIAAWPGGTPHVVAGRARPVADVPVLARALDRGAVIAAADIDWVRLPADRVRPGVLTSEESLIGRAARRPLRAGQPLSSIDVEAPVLIARGETVTLVYRAGALILSAQARALENAAEGEVTRFVNLTSNRTIEAIAESPGRAVVGPRGQILQEPS